MTREKDLCDDCTVGMAGLCNSPLLEASNAGKPVTACTDYCRDNGSPIGPSACRYCRCDIGGCWHNHDEPKPGYNCADWVRGRFQ